jgi:hypothetical protein
LILLNIQAQHVAEAFKHVGKDELGQIIMLAEEEIIGRRGYDDGWNAGSWIVDGNTTDPIGVLRKLIKGIEDGDPEILDSLPEPRQISPDDDHISWRDIIEDELDKPLDPEAGDDVDNLWDSYSEGWGRGVIARIHNLQSVYDPVASRKAPTNGNHS